MVLEIPFDRFNDKKIKIEIKIKPEFDLKNLKVKKPFNNFSKINVEDKKIFIEIEIDKKLNKFYFDKIQNFGNLIFSDGYGRDIGSIVRYQKQFYENEVNQYQKIVERYAACGAAVLFKKSVLSKIGLLDENFFMYYEDVEICERARLSGYKILYTPLAKVYHFHALSSKEWSPFFIYHAEKGRLLHVFYHFPFKIFINEYFKFMIKNIAKFIMKSNNLKSFKLNFQYLKIFFYFLFNFPILIIKRIEKHKNIDKKRIIKNYQRILEGYWYFN